MTTPAGTPYRAIFCDLRTDQTIDVLPLQDVGFDDYLGKPGSLSGTIPVPNAALAERVRRIEEGRTSVYLERGGDLWWGGIIWTSTLQSSDRGVLTLGIQAATFDSYANRRLIRRYLPYKHIEQLELVRTLWRELQSDKGGDIGVSYGDETSDVFRDASWLDGDETSYYDAITQLAAMEDGFEHWIAVYRDPATGRRVRRLRLGSTRIQNGATDLVLDRPGAVLSYSFPRDATRGGTTARARGDAVDDGQSESRPVFSEEKVATDLIDGGYPRVDLSADYTGVTDARTLASLAAATLAAARGAVVIPAVTIRLDDMVPPTLLGQTVRIRITDEWFQGLDARYRIVGLKVSPSQRGRADTAELYLEDA
ncbi:hypothetical protein [Peterkaempfera bronchialis]|uniref:Uncharacterized protein n=1 Tax=Peterkaempfera bronchialis TaxID=2126346 RepID=A0A345SWF8_9ACTN|nr:hypothetical protein [Peterkaempfera bronchialis]AXI78063.1 hypothetical protein C7M71_012035 [Peterkaempfera bronchialis]